ncbi:MAG: CheY-like chemotaxis protein [Psychromonas sp.]|jgi:CheY-like chemotaxis protein|uniref:response regulator n=1 Tax=Psychromonas sp. TaxID=1884585 RepID=UPI0039E499DB
MINEQDIRNAHILIVDDLQINVLLLKDMLTEADYKHIDSTMDPFAVVELHRANKYDLILLDLQMPAMDGFEVMKQLKKIAANDYLPILVITAQPDHKLRALTAGAKDFIAKPFDIIEVNTRIRNMLEVRLLYKELDNYNQQLEKTVRERTAELRDSEARYRSLIELASDWYWEQDEKGNFTRTFGPVQQMLGIENGSLNSASDDASLIGWNEVQRKELQAKITARQPFLDFIFSRINDDGSQQQYQVSGEPIFNQSARFIGYRGFGVELTTSPIVTEMGR